MKQFRSSAPASSVAPELAAPTLVQRSRSFSPLHYWTMVIGLSALIFLLGFAALVITPAGTGVAIWWPAAGVSVLLYLLYRGPRWQVLAIIGGLGLVSNLSDGRSWGSALIATLFLVVEVWAVAWVVGRDGQRAYLSSMRGLGRFLVAVGAGSLAIGIPGAITLFLLAGIDPLASFAALVLSHGSALLLVVPLALVPIIRRPLRVSMRRTGEAVVQFSLTLGLALIVFSPTLPAPMLFTIFPLLAWAASRFRPLYIVIQLQALAVLVPTLAILSGGPFGTAQGVPNAALFVQLFMISSAITTLFLSVTRSEREALVEDKERRASLLRGGFIGAQVGFLILQRHADQRIDVIEANDIGRAMLRGEWLEPTISSWLGTEESDLNREITLPDGRGYQVFASRTEDAMGDETVGVQLVEMTDAIRVREAMARAVERERAVVDELRDLARQKDDFVSAVSHELRTPITSILGFAEELEDFGPSDTKQAAEVIVRNSRRLAAMVEQLLELGRLTSPQFARVMGDTPLDTTVADTAEEQQRSADQGGVSVDLSLQAADARVAVDETTLGRIVTNLLSNAIKFTPTGGRVQMSTSIVDDAAVLHVDDSGVGISLTDRERVFDRFYRSADDAKLAMPGTGLGLSIVRSLVDASGGRITIEDSPLGGTRMTVVLPVVPATAREDSELVPA